MKVLFVIGLCFQVLVSGLVSEGPPEPIPYAVEAPLHGVDITGNTLLEPIMQANIDYLLTSFDINHMLQPFRIRAGKPAPGGKRAPIGFWDTDLLGSNAGRFLMGAGNSLRWISNQTLRVMMDSMVDGIAECRNETDGYILAYPPEGFTHSEQGDYGRSWFTQGLIEAGKSGNQKVWPLLRGQYDWFNDPEKNPYLPYLYDGISNGEQGQIASTRMYLETPVGAYADAQVAQDTYRDNFWMRQMIARDPEGISNYHMPQPNHAHCYEITSFLSWFDNYRATGNATYYEAARGAWELIQENFVHVDGSSSLTEGTPNFPAKSYHLIPTSNTGETCCTTFWIKFSQRFHLLSPNEERYVAQMETAIYNALLRQMAFRPRNEAEGPHPLNQGPSLPPGIRYHARMEGVLEDPQVQNTCCEGQGTRAIGSLPEYIYSVASDGLYINMFESSSLELNASMASGVEQAWQGPALKPAPVPLLKAVTKPSPPPPMSWRLLQRDGWRTGAFCGGSSTAPGARPPCPINVTSLKDCQALCLQSEQPSVCMGLTWLDNTSHHATSPNRCSLYTAIDLGAKASPLDGCQQWLVVGRRQKVQIDYPLGVKARKPSSHIGSTFSKGLRKTTLAKVIMKSAFPYAGNVSIRVSWPDVAVPEIGMKLRIRMPSWLRAPLSVRINDDVFGYGQPGTYLMIDRQWAQGDTISLMLPTVYRLSLYTGVEQVKGYEGKRYALLVGPIVLACVGPMNVGYTTVLPVPPANVEDWLVPTSEPLHYGIRGVKGFQFKPLWAVLAGEKFTTYPILAGQPDVAAFV